MKYIIALIIIFSGLLSCNLEKIITQTDQAGVTVKLPFLWKSRISDGVLGYGLYHGYIIDGKGVLCVAMRKSPDSNIYSESYLQLKNTDTGENIWTWDEFYNKKLVSTLHKSILISENKILLHDLYADYCIDAKTGQTVWRNQRGFGSAMEPTYIGNQYFISGNSPKSKELKKIDDNVFIGDIKTGKLTESIKPPYNSEYAYNNGEWYYLGSLNRYQTFLNGNDVMLLLPYDEMGPQARYNNTRSFFGLYNVSQKKWVYDRSPLSLEEDGAAPSLTPIIDLDKLYLTSLNSIGCFDLNTGKRLWQIKLTEVHTGVLDMIKVENRIIINGDNGIMYCISIDNGVVLWTQQSMSCDLYHQNSIIYGIRGKNLRAIDLQTGKLLWDMPSQDDKEENRPDSWYGGFVTGIPAKDGKKGRIFATTNLIYTALRL